jgi:hypothetical protein
MQSNFAQLRIMRPDSRQRIANSRHCFEIVSQLAVLFLKFRHLGLQLLVLLQVFASLPAVNGKLSITATASLAKYFCASYVILRLTRI